MILASSLSDKALKSREIVRFAVGARHVLSASFLGRWLGCSFVDLAIS